MRAWYWIAAGDVAEQHSANQEAVAHYRSARWLTERNDLTAADRARAAEVLLKLGNAQMQTVGYHSEEPLQSYRQARDAALAFDQPDEAAEAGIRMAPFLFGSCCLSDIMAIGDNILKGSLDRLRSETLVHVWVMMGGASFHRGDFQQSLVFSERAIELDDRVNCTHKAPWAAADPAIVARDYLEMACRMMGYFDRSLTLSEQAMAIALDRGHLFSIVWASVCRIFALSGFGRYAEALACADRAIEICEKHGFDARTGNVLLHRGPVLFELGDAERGLADIRRGVELWRETSGIFMLTRNMAMLASISCERTRSRRPTPASVKPNTMPKRPRKNISWRTSFDYAAVSGRGKVNTRRPGAVFTERSRGPASRGHASLNCTQPETLPGSTSRQAMQSRHLQRCARSWVGSPQRSMFLFSLSAVGYCDRSSVTEREKNGLSQRCLSLRAKRRPYVPVLRRWPTLDAMRGLPGWSGQSLKQGG